MCCFCGTHTLLETNSSHPKMGGWKMTISFGMAHFQGQKVRFREEKCRSQNPFLVVFVDVIETSKLSSFI